MTNLRSDPSSQPLIELPLNRAGAVELLRGLVAIPSLSGAEEEASNWLVAQMHRLGYARAHVDEAGNAVGELGAPDAARTIILLGHIDTVPGNIPVRVEETEDGDVLYGRGSVDAKGPLATFVAAGAKVGNDWAKEHNVRVVVVGAVEEEAATSKGARFISRRFDGNQEPMPDACIIGEPSSWRRVTLGYKGRILLDLDAAQPMAHTAGPDAGVATVAVDLWNRISEYAAEFNREQKRAFDALLPSLRHLQTSVDAQMQDRIAARIGIRLPLDFDIVAFVSLTLQWLAERVEATTVPEIPAAAADGAHLLPAFTAELEGPMTRATLHFRGYEPAWQSARNTSLVRSFLGAIRTVEAGVRPGFVVKTGTSDMNVVGPVWQCPILAYGPGDSALDHTPNEHLFLDEYWRAISVVEQALQAWSIAAR